MRTRWDESRFRTPGAWLRAWRCLLLVCAWQGPIPWCHCHDLAAGSEVTAPQWLIPHLRAFHPSQLADTSRQLGWHWHFGDSAPAGDSEGSSSEADNQYLPVSAEASEPLVSQSAAPNFSQLVADLPAHLPPNLLRRTQAGFPTHFFDGFAPTLPLPLRFGVARC